ncbi:MAG: acetyltransferase [Lachnospiraceae bacterium]|nr:acetyltransferase [Candidatus Colinaster scatohippi]
MKVLAICGLGGAGREILDLVERIDIWPTVVFCDKYVEDDSRVFMDKEVYTFEELAEKYNSDEIEFTISVGDVYLRQKIYNQIKDNGYRLATIVAPNVSIPKTTKLEEGVIVRDNCYISVDVILGANSMIQSNAVVGHDVKLGRHSIVSSQSVIAGGTEIGNNTYLALGSLVKELVKVGDNVIVSMGTAVNKDVADNLVVRGNPMEIVSKNYLKSAFALNMRKK